MLEQWQADHEILEEDVINYITNPLNAILMIKRATANIDLIALWFKNESKDFLRDVEHLRPSHNDLTGAAEGLLRLQTVYKLKSGDFANGIIDGVKTRSRLSAHDLFVIGDEAFKLRNQDYFAAEYLNIAWKMVQNGDDMEGEVDEEQLVLILIEVYEENKAYQNAAKVAESFLASNPGNHNVTLKQQAVLQKYAEQEDITPLFRDPYDDNFKQDGVWMQWKEDILFSQACRGKLTKSEEEQAKLYCRYESTNAFSTLARFKIEEANLKPYIVRFIDVVSQSEIEFLKNISRPNFKRAEVHSSKTKYHVSKARTAKLAYHYDEDYETLEKLSQRVEVIVS